MRRCISSRLTRSSPERRSFFTTRVEEARRHFEQAVGLETVRPRRTNMVQRQNGADAGDKGPKRNMRAA